MGDTLLEAQGVSKTFGGVRAVDQVTLTLSPGECRALIGPNGAGKTTLFHLLTGTLPPDTGKILFRGENITGLSPHRIWRKGLSRTFQFPEIFLHLSVLENVQVACLSRARQSFRLLPQATTRWRQKGEALLAEVGLLDQAEKTAGVLPFGDLKRLELAIALANDPLLLLLDEPTAGLAPQERGALIRLIRTITEEREITVFFTEHDMDVVFALAQSILVMHQGQIVARGNPEEIRQNAEVRRIYLGSRR
ncbi:MAG: ABC transporter ATP-binding protein [Nitrospinota bacterium]|nr:MAG: ABC transporter ATP-binding protein [Nitrospinota bacterium]